VGAQAAQHAVDAGCRLVEEQRRPTQDCSGHGIALATDVQLDK
jgi:hypothetical protein